MLLQKASGRDNHINLFRREILMGSEQAGASRKDDHLHLKGPDKRSGQHEDGQHEEPGNVLANSVMQVQAAAGNMAAVQMMQEASPDLSFLNKGGGSKIPSPVKDKMEHYFGHDFSRVTLHEAAETSAMGAKAMASGSKIFFSPGMKSPESRAGQSLLGHELAHVVQQRQNKVSAKGGKGAQIVHNSGLESEADQAGKAAAGSQFAGAYASAGAGSLAHSPAGHAQDAAGGSAESFAPVQGFFKGLKKFAGKAMGAVKKIAPKAMSMGKKFMDAGGMDMIKGGVSGFKEGGVMGALKGANSAKEGGIGGLLGNMFGGQKKEEEGEEE